MTHWLGDFGHFISTDRCGYRTIQVVRQRIANLAAMFEPGELRRLHWRGELLGLYFENGRAFLVKLHVLSLTRWRCRVRRRLIYPTFFDGLFLECPMVDTPFVASEFECGQWNHQAL